MPLTHYYCYHCKITWFASGTWICPFCKSWGVVYDPFVHELK